jgi:putative acetyltransferase
MEHDTNPEEAEFLIRPVTESDNDTLAGLLRDVMAEFGATGAGTSMHDPEMTDLATAYRTERSAYFVVERDGGLIGGGGFGPLAGAAPGVCELRKMYLRPAARGRGVGRALLARCIDVAGQLGYKQMYLETRQTMQQARRLYERNGFAPVSKPLGHTGHFGCDAWYVRDL